MKRCLANFFSGERQIAHQNHIVTALHVWAGVAEFVYVQLNSRAVAETIVFVVALDSFDFNSPLDPGHAMQGLFDNVGL